MMRSLAHLCHCPRRPSAAALAPPLRPSRKLQCLRRTHDAWSTILHASINEKPGP
jgi:hypothetical protein